jgi:Ran GTPase-activating protein 1
VRVWYTVKSYELWIYRYATSQASVRSGTDSDKQDNTFTNIAGRTLASTLPSWPSLIDLGVGDCLLGARGGVALATALQQAKNTKIEVLRLQYNEIDSKGIKGLCDAAFHSSALPRLRRVELNGNKFSEEDPGVEKLAELLGERKEKAEELYPGVDVDDEDSWGVDELDELEDEDDEDEEEEVDEEEEAEEERIVKDADAAEDEPVSQKKDEEVDELAEALGKTELK